MDLGTCYILLQRLKCTLNLSLEQREVSLELEEKFKSESVLILKVWPAHG